jgi:hypothetical protein
MQWRNYIAAWVAKCQRPRASGGPLGLPASEIKTLKIYISAKYNYLKNVYLLCFLYLMKISKVFVSNSSTRKGGQGSPWAVAPRSQSVSQAFVY